MKAKKKPLGTKAQFRAMKERERYIATAILLAIILVAIALSAHFTYTILDSSAESQPLEQGLIKPSLQFKPETPDSHLRAACHRILFHAPASILLWHNTKICHNEYERNI